MTKTLHLLAQRLQRKLEAFASPAEAPRVMLDAWASLYRWHLAGEPVIRISADDAETLADSALPPDLDLATAETPSEAVAYQLPDRATWIVLARHAPAPAEIVVRGAVVWHFPQPLLTYLTEIDGDLAAGFFSLTDMPTPADLELRPGRGLLSGPLGGADIAEEDWRITLALAKFFR